jgi:hypothetical protein
MFASFNNLPSVSINRIVQPSNRNYPRLHKSINVWIYVCRTPAINFLLSIADFGELCGYMNMHRVGGGRGTVFVSKQTTIHNAFVGM